MNPRGTAALRLWAPLRCQPSATRSPPPKNSFRQREQFATRSKRDIYSQPRAVGDLGQRHDLTWRRCGTGPAKPTKVVSPAGTLDTAARVHEAPTPGRAVAGRYYFFLRVWPEDGSSGIWLIPYPGSRRAGPNLRGYDDLALGAEPVAAVNRLARRVPERRTVESTRQI